MNLFSVHQHIEQHSQRFSLERFSSKVKKIHGIFPPYFCEIEKQHRARQPDRNFPLPTEESALFSKASSNAPGFLLPSLTKTDSGIIPLSSFLMLRLIHHEISKM